MKTYMVGGAVRDKLLGREPRDSDFIVTNAGPGEMLSAGFIPVGKDHAVYLHPVTKEEYGIAENLEADLGRRDLTINAMALDGDSLIDPYHGKMDIENKILKHVKADNFFYDPLRVYRVARLASELPDFHIDPSTFDLLKRVTQEKSFSLITPERIFLELEKTFKSKQPSIFFQTLKEIGALAVHFNELDILDKFEWDHTLQILDKIISFENLPATYGALFIYTSSRAPLALADRLLVPGSWKNAARVVQAHYLKLSHKLPAAEMVETFYQIDAYRNPAIVNILSDLLKSDKQEEANKLFTASYDLTRNISVGDLSTRPTGKELGLAIKQERIKRLKSFQR